MRTVKNTTRTSSVIRRHTLEGLLSFFFSHPTLPRGADTYHDFQPACAVGVMRAVSTPRQHCAPVISADVLHGADGWRGATPRGSRSART